MSLLKGGLPPRGGSDHGFHRTPFGPGLFSKLCGTLARRRQLGSASSSDKLYTLRCATPYYRTAGADTPHPCQPRTSNPSAAAKFPRRARTLTIFPCSAKPMQILPDQRFFGLQDIRLNGDLLARLPRPPRVCTWVSPIWASHAIQVGGFFPSGYSATRQPVL